MVHPNNLVVGKDVVIDLETDDCIIWPLHIGKNGYGYKTDRRLVPGKRVFLAHRWVWMKVHGPIPDDLPLDHVRARGCASNACVNPRHLEMVTTTENNRRAHAVKRVKTICNHGHDLTLPGAWQSAGTKCRCAECVRQRKRTFNDSHPTYQRDYMRARRQRVRTGPAGTSPERMPGRTGDAPT